MHGTTLARTQRTGRTAAGRHRTRALKNRLPRHWTAGRGTHGANGRSSLAAHRSGGRDGTRRRSFVHRARPSLRNDHARCRRLRRTHHRRRCSRTRNDRRLRRGRRGNRWRSRRHHDRRRRRHGTRRRGRRNYGTGNRTGTGRSRRSNGSRPLHRGRNHCRPRCRWRYSRGCRSGRHTRRRRGSGKRRRSDGWSRHNRRRRCGPCGRRCRLFLLRDGSQHISRPGNVRQVNLGLDFFFAAQGTRRAGRGRLRFG